mgnify:CR=1 FL=1
MELVKLFEIYNIAGYDFDEFKKLSWHISYDDYELNELALQYFQELGGGSFRNVYSVGDEFVLKVSNEYGADGYVSGRIANKMDAVGWHLSKYPELFPKAYDAGRGYCWVLQERVLPFKNEFDYSDHFISLKDNSLIFSNIQEHEFSKLVPVYIELKKFKIKYGDFSSIPLKEFPDVFMLIKKYVTNSTFSSIHPYTKKRYLDMNDFGSLNSQNRKDLMHLSKTILSEHEFEIFMNTECPLADKLASVAAEFNLSAWDFRSENCGTTLTDGRFIVLDPGIVFKRSSYNSPSGVRKWR